MDTRDRKTDRAAQSGRIVVVDLLCVSPMYDKYLCEGLLRKGADVVLAAISFHLDVDYLGASRVRMATCLVDVVSRISVRNTSIRRALKMVEYLINLFSLTVWMRLKRVKVVHLQWLPLLDFSSFELFWVRFLRLLGFEVVLTAHNVLPHDRRGASDRRYQKLYEGVDRIIVHTRGASTEIQKLAEVDARKIHVIPMGPFFHDAQLPDRLSAMEYFGLPVGRKIVACIGTIKPYKGVEFLLDAWQIVQRRDNSAILLVAGNGERAFVDKIRKVAKPLVESGRVMTCIKGLSNDEILMLHAASDIVVLPYKDITQSGALLTAMALGKPIVATAVGGFRETLEERHTGRLVEFGNTEQLAGVLLDMLQDDTGTRALGDNAAEFAQTEMSWDAIAVMTMDCYRGVGPKGSNDTHEKAT